MKRLIISEEEKNRILGMHNKQKNMIKESGLGIEPIVVKDKTKSFIAKFYFDIGCPNSKCPNANFYWTAAPNGITSIGEKRSPKKDFINDLSEFLNANKFVDVITYFNKSGINLPQFIKISVATSSAPGNNQQVADNRVKYLKNLLIDTLKSMNLYTDKIADIIINTSQSNYEPTNTDCSVIDCGKAKDNPTERIAEIEIFPIKKMGLDQSSATDLAFNMKDAGGYLFTNYFMDMIGQHRGDEDKIIELLNKAETYSDLKDVSTLLKKAGKGDLSEFLNDNLLSPASKGVALKILQKLAIRSGFNSDKVQMVGGNISLGFDNVKTKF